MKFEHPHGRQAFDLSLLWLYFRLCCASWFGIFCMQEKKFPPEGCPQFSGHAHEIFFLSFDGCLGGFLLTASKNCFCAIFMEQSLHWWQSCGWGRFSIFSWYLCQHKWLDLQSLVFDFHCDLYFGHFTSIENKIATGIILSFWLFCFFLLQKIFVSESIAFRRWNLYSRRSDCFELPLLMFERTRLNYENEPTV